MPGRSEICCQISGIARGPGQRTYHNAGPSGAVGHMSSGKMPQAPLDSIARDCVAKSAADHKPNAGSVIEAHSMDH
jgi:hypothetical protein